jgi:hypothetical protein
MRCGGSTDVVNYFSGHQEEQQQLCFRWWSWMMFCVVLMWRGQDRGKGESGKCTTQPACFHFFLLLDLASGIHQY